MNDQDLITDEEFDRVEKELEELIGAPAKSHEVNPKRIERIIERVSYETVVKDTTSFLFNSFSSAMVGVLSAVMGGQGVAQLPPPAKVNEGLPLD